MASLGKNKSAFFKILSAITLLILLITLVFISYLLIESSINRMIFYFMLVLLLIYILLIINYSISPVFVIDDKGMLCVKNLLPFRTDKYILSKVKNCQIKESMGGYKRELVFYYMDSKVVLNLIYTLETDNNLLFERIKTAR